MKRCENKQSSMRGNPDKGKLRVSVNKSCFCVLTIAVHVVLDSSLLQIMFLKCCVFHFLHSHGLLWQCPAPPPAPASNSPAPRYRANQRASAAGVHIGRAQAKARPSVVHLHPTHLLQEVRIPRLVLTLNGLTTPRIVLITQKNVQLLWTHRTVSVRVLLCVMCVLSMCLYCLLKCLSVCFVGLCIIFMSVFICLVKSVPGLVNIHAYRRTPLHVAGVVKILLL